MEIMNDKKKGNFMMSKIVVYNRQKGQFFLFIFGRFVVIEKNIGTVGQ